MPSPFLKRFLTCFFMLLYSIMDTRGETMETFFKNLTNTIKNHDEIFMMAHKNIDLDAFGSCLAFYQIAFSFNKECYIVLNENVNESIEKTLAKLVENHIPIQYVTEKQALHTKCNNPLLVILDTHKKSLVESEALLDKISDQVVIDHHIKSQDYIKNTLITYINSNISSTVEILVAYLKYLNKTVNSLIATIMLAGIEIDTNSFSLKTTPSTYESASFLSKLGADNLIKTELLQENKENYLKRQDLLKEAFMINDNMALCILDNAIYSKEELARVATELLQFEDVAAGFSIGKLSSKTIGISAKSLGDVNVESIMEALGGGGHINNAACQLENETISSVKKQLIHLVNKEETK